MHFCIHSLKVIRHFCRPKFWSCVILIISNKMITKNFSGSENVGNWFLAPQDLNHTNYYCLMTVALSIAAPIITSGLGPAAQYGVNALNRSYCSSVLITHLLTNFFRVEKNVLYIIICHYFTKSQFLTFSLPEKHLIIIFFRMTTDSHSFNI